MRGASMPSLMISSSLVLSLFVTADLKQLPLQEGADAFVEFAQAQGNPAFVLPERVRSLGGVYVGLGQEENPDGSGPLLGPVPESLP